jgi:hypothetical protein
MGNVKHYYIKSASGKSFNFLEPRQEDICIEDIAHALSQVNRYAGHAPFPYSVARHSILVSYEVRPQNALMGLLHDASEAYLADISRPLKNLLPDYSAIERRVEEVISAKFSLPFVFPPDVKRADLAVFNAEVRDLFPKSYPDEWILPEPAPEGLVIRDEGSQWFDERYRFLKRFADLGGYK